MTETSRKSVSSVVSEQCSKFQGHRLALGSALVTDSGKEVQGESFCSKFHMLFLLTSIGQDLDTWPPLASGEAGQ